MQANQSTMQNSDTKQAIQGDPSSRILLTEQEIAEFDALPPWIRDGEKATMSSLSRGVMVCPDGVRRIIRLRAPPPPKEPLKPSTEYVTTGEMNNSFWTPAATLLQSANVKQDRMLEAAEERERKAKKAAYCDLVTQRIKEGKIRWEFRQPPKTAAPIV